MRISDLARGIHCTECGQVAYPADRWWTHIARALGWKKPEPYMKGWL